MLYFKRSTLRSLTPDELGHVSGGSNEDIVVTAQKRGTPLDPRFGHFRPGGTMRKFAGSSGGGQSEISAWKSDADGDGVSDAEDADPSDPNVQAEIVVNGVRQDIGNREEILRERKLMHGKFVNAEQLPNGDWIERLTPNPTDDQIKYKNNLEKINSALWGYPKLTESNRAELASSLADKGIDLKNSNINIGKFYTEYKNLIEIGEQTDKTSDGFSKWIKHSIEMNILGKNPN